MSRKIIAWYYLMAFTVIILLPLTLIVLYDRLAGGLLNGFWNSWKTPIVHPDFFLLFFNPAVLIAVYVFLIRRYVAYMRVVRVKKTALLHRVAATLVLVLATVVVVVGVFWKVLTT